jgi:peroxiredoxin
MRKFVLALVVLTAIPALVMAWPQPGDPAPSVTLPDTAYVNHTIPGDYAGRVLHLFFWKSIDSSCIAEMPRVQAMYDDYGSQGYRPFAINVLEDMDSVVKVYARQYTYSFLLDNVTAWMAYRMGGYIPLNYVIDSTGLVINSMEGFDESTIRGWVESVLPGVNETHAQPLDLVSLGANPVIGHSAVRFSLPKAANVSLRVYSTSGALVRTLCNGQMAAGSNTVNWDLQNNAGRQVGNGLYLYELNTGSQVAHAKVSVLK